MNPSFSSKRHRRLARLLPALVACAAALPAASAGAAIPPPDQDSFYRPPAHLERYSNGGVLRSRPVTVTAGGVPIPGIRSRQILYRSNDSKGKPIPAVTTLMVPTTRYAGRRPLVSYQAAIDSLGTQCNPSYTLRTGTQKELATLYPLLALGYAVTTPDFEGPRMAYTAGLLAGRTTLDGVRASEALPGTGLAGRRTPLALFGYSGGAQATVWAAEQQPTYAPELRPRAIAAGGIPADIEPIARAADGSLFAGVEFGGVFGVAREFPELRLDSLLNARGKQLKRTMARQCAEQFITAHPGERLRDYTTERDPLRSATAQRVLAANRLGRARPTAAMYLFHSQVDELIPIRAVDGLATKYCRQGARVYYERGLAGEHVAYALTGSPGAYAYLLARFAGAPARNNCGSFPAGYLPDIPSESGRSSAAVDRPLLNGLRLSRSRFRAARRGRAIAPPGRALGRRVGTRVRYRLGRRAKVTFRVQRARRARGRSVGGRCVKRTRRNGKRRRCTRYRTLRGRFASAGGTGTHRLRFSGRLRGHRLRPGRYRLIARARTAAGRRSRPARRRFRIIRR